jgi:hypothetical protein
VTEKRLVENSLRIVMPGDKRRGRFVRDIVDAGDGDIGAAEPFLDIGNVGLVFAFLNRTLPCPAAWRQRPNKLTVPSRVEWLNSWARVLWDV